MEYENEKNVLSINPTFVYWNKQMLLGFEEEHYSSDRDYIESLLFSIQMLYFQSVVEECYKTVQGHNNSA